MGGWGCVHGADPDGHVVQHRKQQSLTHLRALPGAPILPKFLGSLENVAVTSWRYGGVTAGEEAWLCVLSEIWVTTSVVEVWAPPPRPLRGPPGVPVPSDGTFLQKASLGHRDGRRPGNTGSLSLEETLE